MATITAPPESASSSARRTDRELKNLRLYMWCGAVYVVGVLVSWALVAGFVPPPRQNWSAERLAEFYRDNDVAIRIGMEGVLFFAIFYIPMSMGLMRIMQRIEGEQGTLSRMQFTGGVITAMITMGCCVLWLVAAFKADERAPGEIQLASDIGWMIFDMTAMATAFQAVTFGLVCLMHDPRERELLPRWLAYLSAWTAVSFFCVFLMPNFNSGPFSWQGLMTLYVALGLFFIWVVAVIFYGLRAVRILQREEAASQGSS